MERALCIRICVRIDCGTKLIDENQGLLRRIRRRVAEKSRQIVNLHLRICLDRYPDNVSAWHAS